MDAFQLAQIAAAVAFGGLMAACVVVFAIRWDKADQIGEDFGFWGAMGIILPLGFIGLVILGSL